MIEAHARDELGIDTDDMANPWLACITSAISFSIGAAIPLLSSAFISDHVTRCTSPLVTSCWGGAGVEFAAEIQFSAVAMLEFAVVQNTKLETTDC